MVRRLSVLPEARPVSRRRAAFALAIAAVVALHALVLVLLAPAWIEPDEAPPGPSLAVRSVTLPAATAAPAAAAPPSVAAAPPAARTAPRAPARPAPPPPVPSAPVAVEALPPPPPVTDAAPAVEPAPVAAAEPGPVVELPVYPTRLPAAGTWRYLLTRGIASGEAQLSWQPDAAAARYELRLEGWIAGLAVLDWASTGAIDGAGIAPDRFAIRRRGRDSQAANFQRDAGKITWSGPTHEVPLLPGVQDRLSWMLQLPAVIEADPGRYGAGASVVLMVIGARGGADVWTFQVIGPEPVGDTPALKLLREPRRPRDLQVQVWLDPARGHLPLRALLAPPEGGQPLELAILPGGSTGP